MEKILNCLNKIKCFKICQLLFYYPRNEIKVTWRKKLKIFDNIKIAQKNPTTQKSRQFNKLEDLTPYIKQSNTYKISCKDCKKKPRQESVPKSKKHSNNPYMNQLINNIARHCQSTYTQLNIQWKTAKSYAQKTIIKNEWHKWFI